MQHRNGKKFRGTHTTLTDLALVVADIAIKLPEVKGVSPGHIQTGKGVAGGARKVKIGSHKGGVLLTVRQARSVQELRIFFTSGEQATKLALARALRDQGIPISFGRDD